MLEYGGAALTKPRLLVSIFAVSVVLASCQSEPAAFNVQPVSPSDVMAVRTVFTATSRAPSDDPSQMFDGQRSMQLSFVELDIGIPEQHRPGRVERAASGHDPARHFTLVGRRSIPDAAVFKRDINRSLRQLPAGNRDLFIFVHGYNNSFASGVFRQSQMLHDFGSEAVALHYSWPSIAKPQGYVYDRDSAIFAEDGLVEVLRMAAASDAGNVTLFAHSMGSQVTMQALRLLAVSGDRRTLAGLDTVVLAAPDVDIDVFDRALADLGPNRPREIAVLASQNDNALRFSSTLRGGHPRVGQGQNAEFLRDRGIVVFDVSDLDGGGHATFAGSPTLIEIVRSDALRQTVESAREEQAEAVVINSAGDAASLLIFLPGRALSAVAGCTDCPPSDTTIEPQR